MNKRYTCYQIIGFIDGDYGGFALVKKIPRKRYINTKFSVVEE